MSPRDRSPHPPPETWQATFNVLLEAQAVESLRIGCTFIPETEPGNWYGIVHDPRRFSLVQFELARGLDRDRTQYNLACLTATRRTRRTRVGQRAGWSDLFVPVVRDGRLVGVLVLGPFLTRTPTRATLEEGWRSLTGARSDPNEEGYLLYIRSIFDSHVFEGDALEALKTFAESFAATMAGNPRAPSTGVFGWDAWRSLRDRLPELRMRLAQEMVDRDENLVLTAPYKRADLAYRGITRLPNCVVTVAPRESGAHGLDGVSRLLAAYALQRACAKFAAELPNTIAGRVGTEAAFLLTHVPVRPRGARARVRSFVDRAARFVQRRLHIDVACGVGRFALHGRELPARYDESLRAGLWGVHKSLMMSFYEDLPVDHEATSTAQLYRSTRTLFLAFGSARVKESRVGAEQVTRDVLWISGGSPEVMRTHFLEILWELLAITERRTVIDHRTSSGMLTGFSGRLRKALTTTELAGAFVHLVDELSEMAVRPAHLGRRAKLELARRLVDQGDRHGKLDLGLVAKSVGMSVPHFSQCFRETYGTSFMKYAFMRRIEQSKELLRETRLRVAEVSEEAGWSSPSYFHQAFKRATGSTPEQYRDHKSTPSET